MNRSYSTRRWMLGVTLLLGTAAVLVWQGKRYRDDPYRDLPKQYSFTEKPDDWKAYGGTWEVSNGAMQNASDERGAKLIAGSPLWTDYVVDADLQLSGSPGNAGLIVRAGDAEEGVDAYRGYYAGISSLPFALTSSENLLLLGKADHGWKEFLRVRVHGGVDSFHWYHLRLLAYGCHIAATAAPSDAPERSTTVSAVDPDCIAAGKIGLRSYTTGASWRNVVVRRATAADLQTMLALQRAEQPAIVPPLTEEPGGQDDATDREVLQQARVDASVARRDAPAENVQPIQDLRLLTPGAGTFTTVRGFVVATKPALYIQDANAGIEVRPLGGRSFNLGDEVQATGQLQVSSTSLALDAANVTLLWSGVPLAPLSVSASQAAIGSINPALIQVKGYVTKESRTGDGSSMLFLDEGGQTFGAVMSGERALLLAARLKRGSLISVQGVCTADPEFTHNLVPFVVLLRSTDDLGVIADPPWWNTGHMIALGLSAILLLFTVQFLYGRIENWRMRAVIEERSRLAHEMHDTLSQSFAGIGFQLQAVQSELPELDSKLRQHVDLACTLVKQSHEESRRCIATLRPESLEQVGLFAALERSARRMVEGGTIRIQTSCTGTPEALPVRVSDTLFRIGQEALSNAVRHAEAKLISISIAYTKRAVELRIEDDGIGFESEGALLGFGLRGMRERAHAAGSKLRIESTPGHGSRIAVTAPLASPLSLYNFPRYLWKYVKEHRSHAIEHTQWRSHSHRG